MWKEAKLVASDLDIEVKLYRRTKCIRKFHADGDVTTDADLSEIN